MEDGQSHEMEQSEPSLAEPKYWSRDQRDLLLSHLDAVDAIDRAHAALTKAAKALKKLGGPTMAEGVSEETYRAAVRADDEAHAAYQEAKRASKETEKELGVLAEVLPQLNVARKAGRESVRQELYALAKGAIAVV